MRVGFGWEEWAEDGLGVGKMGLVELRVDRVGSDGLEVGKVDLGWESRLGVG